MKRTKPYVAAGTMTTMGAQRQQFRIWDWRCDPCKTEAKVVRPGWQWQETYNEALAHGRNCVDAHEQTAHAQHIKDNTMDQVCVYCTSWKD